MRGSKSLLTLGLALACAAITFSLAVRAQAQSFSYFANFNARTAGVGLVQATDGNFYMGGYPGAYGQGAIYRVTPSAEFEVLYSFCAQRGCRDGRGAVTPILGRDGNFYGVTEEGGNRFDGGTVYRMTLGGEITTLYSFCITNECPEGAQPLGIIQASDGNLYGVTIGAAMQDSGTLFRVKPITGEFKVMHYFCSTANCTDGYNQFFGPMQGSDGNLYGTTYGGGANGGGVLYQLTAAGEYRVLYNFCSLSGCLDGGGPSPIVQDANGNFFGETEGGGSKGYGTVFELTSTNQYVVLDNFDFVRGTPLVSLAGLTLANDGNFYGSTQGGENAATVYKVTPPGEIAFLNTFGTCTEDSGWYLDSPIFQATNGTLYGTTAFGNSDGDCNPYGSGYGTIYSLTGLNPLVETVPVRGTVGTSVIILGNNLTGTSSVTFNGVEAEFTVESDTYIKATVPRGATTGTVSVVTSSGTLKSNPQFVVTK
jgi:uncharacterized repeat protein (TIGR03803 family)